jgi:hypothetical protein
MLNGLFIENWNMLCWLRLQDANVGNIDMILPRGIKCGIIMAIMHKALARVHAQMLQTN